MGLEAVLSGPQNALYVMLCYVIFAQLKLPTLKYRRTRGDMRHMTEVCRDRKTV